MLTTKLRRIAYHGSMEKQIHTVLRVNLSVDKAPYESVIPNLLLRDTGVLGCTYDRNSGVIWVLAASDKKHQVHDDIDAHLTKSLEDENVEEPSLDKITYYNPEDVPECTLAKLHLSMVTSLDLPDGEISYNAGGRIYHRNPQMKHKDSETDEVWTDVFHLSDDMVLSYGICSFTRYGVLEKEVEAIGNPKEKKYASDRLHDALGGAHMLTESNQLRHVLRRDKIPQSNLYIPLKTKKRREQKNTVDFIRADIDGPYPDRSRTLYSVLNSLNEAVDGYAQYDFTEYSEMPIKTPKAINPFKLLKGQRINIENYTDSSFLSQQLASYVSNVMGMTLVDDSNAMTLAVVPEKPVRDAEDRYLTHHDSSRIVLQHFVNDDNAKHGLERFEAGRDKYLDRLDMWKKFHGEESQCYELDDNARFPGKRSGKSLRFPSSEPTFSGRWLEADKAVIELLVKNDISTGVMSAFPWKSLGLELPLYVAHYLKNREDDGSPFYSYLKIDPDGTMTYQDDDDTISSTKDRRIFSDIIFETQGIQDQYLFLSGGHKAPGAYIATLDSETPIFIAKTDLRALPSREFMKRELLWNGRKTKEEARKVLGSTAGVHFADISCLQRNGKCALLFSVGKSPVGRKDMNEPRGTAIYVAISDDPIPCDLLLQLICQKIVKTKDYSLPIIKKYMDEYARYRNRIKRIDAIANPF